MTATPPLATLPASCLEPLVPAHADAAYAAFADPALYRYMVGAPPRAPVALRDEFARSRAEAVDPDERWLNWLAFRRDDRALVGLAPGHARRRAASIAWVTFPAPSPRGVRARRRGGGRRVARDAQGVREIDAQSDERNVASCGPRRPWASCPIPSRSPRRCTARPRWTACTGCAANRDPAGATARVASPTAGIDADSAGWSTPIASAAPALSEADHRRRELEAQEVHRRGLLVGLAVEVLVGDRVHARHGPRPRSRRDPRCP